VDEAFEKWPLCRSEETLRGSRSLRNVQSQCHEQCLDVIPDYDGIHRVVENSLQCFAVLTVHKNLASLSDTVVNGFVDEQMIRGTALFTPSVGT
jgi:hypothetical protein